MQLPASSGGHTLKHSRKASIPEDTSPSCLAPGGVYRATWVTPGADGLLHPLYPALTSASAYLEPRSPQIVRKPDGTAGHRNPDG
jgi:hypothetical protein